MKWRGVNYFDMEWEPFVGNGMLVLFGDGDQVMVTTEAEAVRFLLVSGTPIGEPVAWYGPIVMNTEEELRVAFKEYGNGTFIKPEDKGGHPGPPLQHPGLSSHPVYLSGFTGKWLIVNAVMLP